MRQGACIGRKREQLCACVGSEMGSGLHFAPIWSRFCPKDLLHILVYYELFVLILQYYIGIYSRHIHRFGVF